MLDISDEVRFILITFTFKSGVRKQTPVEPPERFIAREQSPVSKLKNQYANINGTQHLTKGSEGGLYGSARFDAGGLANFLHEKDFALVNMDHQYECRPAGHTLHSCEFTFVRNGTTSHRNESSRLDEFEALTEGINWHKSFRAKPDKPHRARLYLQRPKQSR